MRSFEDVCREYLSGLGINALRSYGRKIGVPKPTEQKKAGLIELIICVLSGKLAPVPQSKLGAPIKNDYVDPQIVEKMQAICARYFGEPEAEFPEGEQSAKTGEKPAFDFQKEYAKFRAKQTEYLLLEDPSMPQTESDNVYMHHIHRGQLQTLNGVPCLLPLTCIEQGPMLFIPIELIHANDLREGDLISCYAQKGEQAYIATRILTVNEREIEGFHRENFDRADACYPKQRLRFFEPERSSSVLAKYMEWLLPVGKGQRALLLSAPKAGKTQMLYQILQSLNAVNPEVRVLTLLVGQPPEEIARFRKIANVENLVYTSYEDEPERQIFTADFLLYRAKRLAESGTDVVLLLDGFSALARAYNDTADSAGGKILAGGLESKTLQYVKKYFGAARCLEKGGSLTILGTVCTDTGNPADELLASELNTLANLQLRLNESLALQRIYPALDLSLCRVPHLQALTSAREGVFAELVKREYTRLGAAQLHELLSNAQTYEEFLRETEKRLQ